MKLDTGVYVKLLKEVSKYLIALFVLASVIWRGWEFILHSADLGVVSLCASGITIATLALGLWKAIRWIVFSNLFGK